MFLIFEKNLKVLAPNFDNFYYIFYKMDKATKDFAELKLIFEILQGSKLVKLTITLCQIKNIVNSERRSQ